MGEQEIAYLQKDFQNY